MNWHDCITCIDNWIPYSIVRKFWSTLHNVGSWCCHRFLKNETSSPADGDFYWQLAPFDNPSSPYTYSVFKPGFSGILSGLTNQSHISSTGFFTCKKLRVKDMCIFFDLVSSLKLLSTPKPCHPRPEICSQVFTMLYTWKSLKCTMSINWISSTHCPCSFFKIKLHNQQGVQIHVPTISCL